MAVERSREAFWRDMCIVFKHPEYRDMKPIDALGKLKRERGEYA